jgi:hypothetical protein
MMRKSGFRLARVRIPCRQEHKKKKEGAQYYALDNPTNKPEINFEKRNWYIACHCEHKRHEHGGAAIYMFSGVKNIPISPDKIPSV